MSNSSETAPDAAREGRAPRNSTYRGQKLRDFVVWLALPTALVYGVVCALVLLALHVMGSQINSVESERGRQSIRAAVEALVHNLGEHVSDEASWTDAYINTYVSPSLAWFQTNWANATPSSDVYDTVIVTDVEGNIVFGDRKGQTLEGKLSDHFSGAENLLSSLDLSGTRSRLDYHVAELSLTDPGVSILAGEAIQGTSAQPAIPRELRRILWMSRLMNDRLLKQTVERFKLPIPLLSDRVRPGQDSLALVDAAGNDIGTLVWEPLHPGDEAFRYVARLALMVMLVIGVLVILVLAAFATAVRSRAVSEERDFINARYDPVTGLPNSFGLEESLTRQFSRRRKQLQLAALHVGIDNFDDISGFYGREVGHQLLNALADQIEIDCGPDATLARVGPADFVLARSGNDAPEMMREFAACITDIAAASIAAGQVQLKPSLSLGYAQTIATAETVAEVLRMAETAKGRARETGGNHVVAFDPVIDDEREARLVLEADIRRGIEADEFDLDYQPLIDTNRERIAGVEALMRWRRRAAGPISPSVFIPAAEASGLIDDLGMFALKRAITEIGPFPNLKISVNVSTAQLRNPHLVNVIFDTLAAARVAPDRLQLEITESFLMTHPERARRLIESLRARGVIIALDDFGTGYSSVGYLRQFPFDRVKLDRSLVENIDMDGVKLALVESTLLYTFAMDLAVTAEGVERREEAAELIRLGCHEFQGYFFARPMSIDGLRRLLDPQTAESTELSPDSTVAEEGADAADPVDGDDEVRAAS